MKNKNIPSSNDFPSMGKLIKSTILAICIATIILITVVLPAEYGIDPIGVGEMIGLAKMGKIKVSLAQEAAIEQTMPIQKEKNTETEPEKTFIKQNDNSRQDKFTINLKPNEGKEIKLTMTKGATVNYFWHTDGGKANYDAHGDSKKLEIKYHSYEKGQLEKSEGIMEAAFDGNHGWFWRNRTSKTMQVTLEVNGDYIDVLQY